MPHENSSSSARKRAVPVSDRGSTNGRQHAPKLGNALKRIEALISGLTALQGCVRDGKRGIQAPGGGRMNRVGPAAAVCRCDCLRAGTIATARRAGKGWALAAGTLPTIEMQMLQRLEPELVAWVCTNSSVLNAKISSMLLSAAHRWNVPASN